MILFSILNLIKVTSGTQNRRKKLKGFDQKKVSFVGPIENGSAPFNFTFSNLRPFRKTVSNYFPILRYVERRQEISLSAHFIAQNGPIKLFRTILTG